MADIRRYPFLRHVRADAVNYILHYRGTRIVHSGVGISFWLNPMTDSLAEVPTDDRDVALVIHGRTSDFQDLTVNGVLTYRAANPERLAERIDFTVDTLDGDWLHEPLDKVSLSLSQLAQEYALQHIIGSPLGDLLTRGVAPVRDAIDSGLRATPLLAEMGLDVVTVRVSSVAPSADLEKAIEAPTRERIKQQADEAAYARRALAVEKERAIAENEMQNKIELAKREELLIEQQGANARRQAEDAALASKIEADAQAARIKTVEGARTQLEQQRLEFMQQVPPAVLLALAAREFGTKIRSIDHLNLTPDLLGTLVSDYLTKKTA